MIKKLHMEIIDEDKGTYHIKISGSHVAFLKYNPETRNLSFENTNEIVSFLRDNEYQFRKLLHNKRNHTFHKNFTLDFSIIDGKDVQAFNDKNNLMVSDHGKIYALSEDKKKDLTEIFTDGSFHPKRDAGAFAFLVKNKDGSYIEKGFISESKSSALIELEAVIAALEYYTDDVRIVTDSQYARKGIGEWIIHWKLNNWTTANGTKAKNIDMWMRLDELCSSRYVEFAWVKAHSSHFENDYCDLHSRALIESL
ncbi:MAG: ribonuclease HI [Spirochaetes bacterium]|nr:ribonuclease HI [Spirochaetota bacterium]